MSHRLSAAHPVLQTGSHVETGAVGEQPPSPWFVDVSACEASVTAPSPPVCASPVPASLVLASLLGGLPLSVPPESLPVGGLLPSAKLPSFALPSIPDPPPSSSK